MRKNKGITLMALVITIIVMLILVGVTLQITLGEDGIIGKTKEAREQSEKASKQEEVSLAIADLVADRDGDTRSITPQDIVNRLNTINKTDEIFAGDMSFATEIVYPATITSIHKEIRVPVDLDFRVGNAEDLTNEEARARIYNYQVIDATAKTVKITSIKEGFKEYIDVIKVTYKLKYNNKEIKELTVPDTVKINGVEYTVTSIGNSVFLGCNNVTSITIPDSITSIGNTVFYGCSSLKSIKISSSIISIGSQVFAWSTALTNINVDEANNNYSSDGGVLFNKNKTIILYYPAGKTETQYSIPSSVTSIESSAFVSCTYLTSITIPSSVTEIKNSGFYYNRKLTDITVDTANSNYSSDENGILFNKNKTTIVCYPGGKTATQYSIPSSVTSIAAGAFVGCIYLENIAIPSSVTVVEGSAFYYCNLLTNINVDTANSNYSSDENGILFNKNKTTIVCYPGGKTATQYSIPSSVTSIGIGAFTYCTKLTNIIIPNSVINIGNNGFDYCTSLREITIPSNVTSIGTYAFYRCTSLTNINISKPKDSISGSPWRASSETVITWNYTGE